MNKKFLPKKETGVNQAPQKDQIAFYERVIAELLDARYKEHYIQRAGKIAYDDSLRRCRLLLDRLLRGEPDLTQLEEIQWLDEVICGFEASRLPELTEYFERQFTKEFWVNRIGEEAYNERLGIIKGRLLIFQKALKGSRESI